MPLTPSQVEAVLLNWGRWSTEGRDDGPAGLTSSGGAERRWLDDSSRHAQWDSIDDHYARVARLQPIDADAGYRMQLTIDNDSFPRTYRRVLYASYVHPEPDDRQAAKRAHVNVDDLPYWLRGAKAYLGRLWSWPPVRVPVLIER